MTNTNKIKKWLIRKLGGIPEREFIKPPVIKTTDVRVEKIAARIPFSIYETVEFKKRGVTPEELFASQLKHELTNVMGDYMEIFVCEDVKKPINYVVGEMYVVRPEEYKRRR